jgi:hypothetical protein
MACSRTWQVVPLADVARMRSESTAVRSGLPVTIADCQGSVTHFHSPSLSRRTDGSGVSDWMYTMPKLATMLSDDTYRFRPGR